MDAALLFLAFTGTYVLFMTFAYRLAKLFFPKVDIKDENLNMIRPRPAKKRMASR
jgi:hypothetical protein